MRLDKSQINIETQQRCISILLPHKHIFLHITFSTSLFAWCSQSRLSSHSRCCCLCFCVFYRFFSCVCPICLFACRSPSKCLECGAAKVREILNSKQWTTCDNNENYEYFTSSIKNWKSLEAFSWKLKTSFLALPVLENLKIHELSEQRREMSCLSVKFHWRSTILKFLLIYSLQHKQDCWDWKCCWPYAARTLATLKLNTREDFGGEQQEKTYFELWTSFWSEKN